MGDEDGSSRAEVAAAAVVRVLLERGGADPTRRDRSGVTPAHSAALAGSLLVLRILRERQLQSCDECDEKGWGGGERFEGLLAAAGRDVTGRNLLHCAASEGNASVITLLEPGLGELWARDVDGATPLHYAVAKASGLARTLTLYPIDVALTQP